MSSFIFNKWRCLKFTFVYYYWPNGPDVLIEWRQWWLELSSILSHY